MQDSGTPDAPRPLVGDIVYAEAILDAARKASADRHRKRAWLPALLRALGNGFVLLVVGALITDVLVPRYQTRQADRAARRAARQEALARNPSPGKPGQRIWVRLVGDSGPVALEPYGGGDPVPLSRCRLVTFTPRATRDAEPARHPAKD